MRILLLLPIVYFAAVVETSLVDVMRIGQVAPDLLALTAMVWLLAATGPRAFLAAGAIALAGDLIAPGRLGVGMGWMLLLGYGLTRLRARVKLDHLLVQVPAVLVTVTLWAVAVGLTGRLLGDVSVPWSMLLSHAAGVGLYTAALSLPVLMVAGWIRQPYLARQARLAEF